LNPLYPRNFNQWNSANPDILCPHLRYEPWHYPGTFHLQRNQELTPIFGFFEVIVGLLTISQIMNNLTNSVASIAYWARFAAGTYIGMDIEEKISLGLVSVRIITKKKDPGELIQYLRLHKYGVTSLDGKGGTGKVKMVFTIIKRQNLPHLVGIIKQLHPNALYSVDDVKSLGEEIFPENRSPRAVVFSWMDSLRFYRKGN